MQSYLGLIIKDYRYAPLPQQYILHCFLLFLGGGGGLLVHCCLKKTSHNFIHFGQILAYSHIQNKAKVQFLMTGRQKRNKSRKETVHHIFVQDYF